MYGQEYDYDDDYAYDDDGAYGYDEAALSPPGMAATTTTTGGGGGAPSHDLLSEARTLDLREALEMQAVVVDKVASLTCLSANAAALLLANSLWSKEVAVERYFGDSTRELQKLGLTPESASHSNTLCRGPGDTQTMCDICCMEYSADEVCCLSSCRHYFCKECWQDHIKQHIHHNLLATRCPAQGCSEVIGIDNMVQLFDSSASTTPTTGVAGTAAETESSPVLKDIYREYLSSFVQFCPSLYWCPNPVGCTGIIHVEVPPLQGQGVTCEVCHHPYCLRCSGDPHRPATCDDMRSWRRYCSAEGANIAFILVRTKRCPKCHRDIEKNGGCNHMTCKCGHQFCWVCGYDWASHSGDFYSCKNASAAPVKSDREDVRQSQRFMYHYERYTLHLDSAKRDANFIASYTINGLVTPGAVDTARKGVAAANPAEAVANPTDVMTLIKNTLTSSRGVIAHAYVQMFYLTDTDSDAMMLAHRVGKLEEATEQLSGKIVDYLRMLKEDVGPMLDLVQIINRWQCVLCEA